MAEPRIYRIFSGSSRIGEVLHSAGRTEFRVAGPAGEAWMTLLRELVGDPGLLVLLPGHRTAMGPHDRDPGQLEAALELATRTYPIRVEGLAPRPEEAPDPALESALQKLREHLEADPALRGIPAGDLGRTLEALFDLGSRGGEPLRRSIDVLADRLQGAGPMLESFAKRWTRFRVERPERRYQEE